jgi:hypothetical protein
MSQGWPHNFEEDLLLRGRLLIKRWPHVSRMAPHDSWVASEGLVTTQGWPHDLELASCFRGGHMILRWPCYSGVAS